MRVTRRRAAGLALGGAIAAAGAAQAADESPQTFGPEEIVDAASAFFGVTTEAVAPERLFREEGRPTAYVAGEEIAGAVGVGLRYGQGELFMKAGQRRTVYWQGPSIGFDTGGNASKVFTLAYNLYDPDDIYRRFPGVEGSAYFVAGIGVNYQRAEGITLAPMRTGVGLRAGANVGYIAYSRKRRWVPL